MYANNPMQAYDTVSRATLSGREIEAAVLTKAALKLKNCQRNWDGDDHEVGLDEALKFNQRMWSILQGELMREDNPLPKNVQRDLAALGAFVDKRIIEVIAYPSPEKLNIVIDINHNIAAGLRNSPSEN
jgi:flagellar biosynthesis activator protein FlaF